MADQTEADIIIDNQQPLIFEIFKEMMQRDDLGGVGHLVARAVETGKAARMVGRLMLVFPEYGHQPEQVFEDDLCRKWMATLEEAIPFICVMLEPTKTLPLLVLSTIVLARREGKIVPSQEDVMQFLLNRGMIAYQFARWQELDAKPFAGSFLTSAGLGSMVNPALLDEYEAVYEQSQKE